MRIRRCGCVGVRRVLGRVVLEFELLDQTVSGKGGGDETAIHCSRSVPGIELELSQLRTFRVLSTRFWHLLG